MSDEGRSASLGRSATDRTGWSRLQSVLRVLDGLAIRSGLAARPHAASSQRLLQCNVVVAPHLTVP
ncbi:hypothetical protein Poly51_17420 [Rubripirellula tenax]|uniref:Uncharacterized protein n=1 Tax=Rubripirellula tenax TaxID=2528015 RepID=A0A5C6FH97_9BACT|nr:hypothetical protein Poly51_17420 [Rubripirellula tenax]